MSFIWRSSCIFKAQFDKFILYETQSVKRRNEYLKMLQKLLNFKKYSVLSKMTRVIMFLNAHGMGQHCQLHCSKTYHTLRLLCEAKRYEQFQLSMNEIKKLEKFLRWSWVFQAANLAKIYLSLFTTHELQQADIQKHCDSAFPDW